MKKTVTAILAVLFALCALCGCDTVKSELVKKEGIDYTFAGHEIGDPVYVKVIDAGLGSEWIDALAAAYFEETGITVDTSADPSLVGSVETKMGQAGSEKEDIYYVAQGNSNWLDWTNKGKIASLNDVLSSEKYGTSAASRAQEQMVLDLGKYGNDVYLLPYIYSNWGLIYNSAYLDKIESYGAYTKGEWPKTMQGLIDLCTAVENAKLKNPRTGKTVKPFSCGLTVNYMNHLFYALWDELDSEGLSAYLNQNDRSAFNAQEFNSNEVKSVFETLYDLIGAKNATESNLCAAAEDHLAAQTNFVNGNCVFTFSGVWFENEMKRILNSVGLTTYHYGSYPVMKAGGQNRLFMNLPGEFFFIPSDAENVWGAKDFLAYCMSEKGLAAASRKLSMPLAFTTDETVEFTEFGKEIEKAVAENKKLYYFSENEVYKTGALRLFIQNTSPFLQMSKYQITSKSEIQAKCINSEIDKHNELWTDYMKHLG